MFGFWFNAFSFFSSVKGRWAFAFLTVLALYGGYVLAPFLPPVWGWENGLIENAQVLLLLLGGCWALQEARQSRQTKQACFWWVITPIWFVMALRELSWGACLLMPLHMDPLTGPTFSSTQQLFYKPLIAPLLMAMLAAQAFAAVRWRIDTLWPVIWRAHAIPVLEILVFIASFLVSTAAEGHMGMHISGLSDGSDQLLEEWAELWAYLALFAGQARVLFALRKTSPQP